MEDFILSKHGKGKNAKYYKIVNKPYGKTEISRSTYYRLSKILEKRRECDRCIGCGWKNIL